MMWRRLGRALTLRCPYCGGGGIFRRWVAMEDACPSCGRRFERHEGYFLGAVAINTVVTIGVFGATLVLWAALAWPDPPWAAITIAGVAVTIVFPVVFHPWSRTLWVAMESAAERGEARDTDRGD